MLLLKEKKSGRIRDVAICSSILFSKVKFLKHVFLFLIFLTLINGLYAETPFPNTHFWSLDMGGGMSDMLEDGVSFGFVFDPKLSITPAIMIGSRFGANFSTDEILTFETQAYFRWNFLRFGKKENTTNIFIQGGIGVLASYRGTDHNPFNDVTLTRGSLLFDAAAGITIPFSERWHIEPSIRAGYPHLFGFSITAGYKFKLPEKTVIQETGTAQESQPEIKYVEVIKTLPPNEIIKRIMITSVDFILFGPNIVRYNVGIDRDAQSLNELVLKNIAQLLKDNPGFRVRIEGHANPVTTDPNEVDELMSISSLRSNSVSQELKSMGVSEEQMVIIAFGGTRTVTSDQDIWNRNRRVELIVIQLGVD